MCFSRLKNIKSLTSKNSGTLIVITALERAATNSFKSGIVCVGWGEENDNPSLACAASKLIGGKGVFKSKVVGNIFFFNFVLNTISLKRFA
jgi:hypothetical protein